MHATCTVMIDFPVIDNSFPYKVTMIVHIQLSCISKALHGHADYYCVCH